MALVRQRVLPCVLAALAGVSGVAALVVHPGAGTSPPVRGVVTAPVLSPRRVPVLLTGLVGDIRLAQRLNATLSDPALGGAQGANCMEVRLNGSTIYARRPDIALLPASNLKLLTGLAVLTRFGAGATLQTQARATDPPTNGVINGPLWLVGGGDPLLVTAGYRASQTEFTWSAEPASHLEDLADKLKAAGVRSITGGVLGDDSRYDRQRSLPTWKPTYLSDGEIGAVGALIVNGGFQAITRRVAARSPATTAAGDLTALLQQRGIQVSRPAGSGTAPPASVVVSSLPSLPLEEIVKVMLKESDNLSAEMLTKELGRRFGAGGTWPSGLQAIHDTLVSTGLPLAGLALLDGSGLDRGDRTRCDTLAQAVSSSAGPAAAVDAGLPTAARDGTLVHRMAGQPSAGRLRAKTGSLTGVAALTGFIDPPSGVTPVGSPPAFALLANNLVSDAAGRTLEDRVAAILAGYPEAPSSAGLAPPASTG